MNVNSKPEVHLSVAADSVYLPLVTSFVENGAIGLGMGRAEAMSLTLATEEIFSYLCQIATPEEMVEIRCSGGGYYVRAVFLFSVEDFNMRAFNLTTTVSVDDEESLEEMGLLIASRMVERFQVSKERGKGVQLTLIKEKKYPASEEETVPAARNLAEFSIQDPNPEEIKLLALLVSSYYRDWIIPGFFEYPGKLVDMVESGECRAAMALAPDGHVGGGIIWRWTGLKTVECFGPYLFNQDPDSSIPEALLETAWGLLQRHMPWA